MQLTIDRTPFLAALSLAQGIADRKSTLPILANVLLRASGQSVRIAATDLGVTLIADVPAKVTNEGALTIGASQLHEIVKSLSGDSFTIRSLDNHYAEITAGKSKFKIVGMADRDFPKLPTEGKADYQKCDAATLADMIRKVSFSMFGADDIQKAHYAGAFLAVKDGAASMVTTDTKRLTRIVRPFACADMASIDIPRKGLSHLAKLIDGASECELLTNAGHLFVRCGAIVLAAKLVEAQPPPWEMALPKETRTTVTIDRATISGALHRALLMAPQGTGCVKIVVGDGALRITADNPDLGDSEDEVEATIDGPGLVVAFNARYLIDFIDACESKMLRLKLCTELDPGVMEPVDGGSYMAIVMPVRLDSR